MQLVQTGHKSVIPSWSAYGFADTLRWIFGQVSYMVHYLSCFCQPTVAVHLQASLQCTHVRSSFLFSAWPCHCYCLCWLSLLLPCLIPCLYMNGRVGRYYINRCGDISAHSSLRHCFRLIEVSSYMFLCSSLLTKHFSGVGVWTLTGPLHNLNSFLFQSL